MSKVIRKISVILAASVFCLAIPSSVLANVGIKVADSSTSRDFADDSSATDDRLSPSDNQPMSSVRCENLTTVAYQGNARAEIVRWTSNEFGGNYTREERCRLVSERFNRAIQENNGSFQGLKLTNGPVNDRIVICVLKPGETDCTTSNMLFTLKRSNERNSGRILGQLMQVGDNRAGVIEENSGNQTVVDLSKWAKQKLRTTQSPAYSPSPAPSVRPNQSPNGAFR